MMLNLLRKIEPAIKLVSLLDLLLLAVVSVTGKFGIYFLPESLSRWGLPVLTAAAIGYLTNYLAIWMLFKPYGRKRLFGFRYQGVIPREQPQLARALGEQIPQYLLKPEEITTELSGMLRDTLQDRQLLDRMRERVNRFMQRYSDSAAAFLVPHIEEALKTALRDNFTPENLRLAYEAVVLRFLEDGENRRLLAGGVAVRIRAATPDLLETARPQLRAGVAEYLKTEYPTMGRILPVDRFVDHLDNYLNWPQIELLIQQKLSTPEVQAAISDELMKMSLAVRDYLGTEKAQQELRRTLADGAEKLERFLHDYLAAKLPGLVDDLLAKDEFWDTIENQLLPLLQGFLDRYLAREGKAAITAKLNLSGRIEKSVNELDMAELHSMVNKIAGEHLSAIQILGFVLGGLAGILLVLSS